MVRDISTAVRLGLPHFSMGHETGWINLITWVWINHILLYIRIRP